MIQFQEKVAGLRAEWGDAHKRPEGPDAVSPVTDVYVHTDIVIAARNHTTLTTGKRHYGFLEGQRSCKLGVQNQRHENI